jgi:diguanylate cyclase (GGDEF)-like protein/PAS domain S-box-containing protein
MNDLQTIRILYMEDDPGLARLMQKRLHKAGYAVDTACNGAEGIAMTTTAEYDILLVDYNMPVCGGIDVLHALTRRGGFPPTIMVTGSGSEKVAVEALKLGATDYVVKDLEMGYLELLPMIIEQVLYKQRLIREREEMFAALQRSEERYRRLVELSPDGIALLVDGKFAFLNPAGMELLGIYEQKELLGRAMVDLIHPDYRTIFAAQAHCVVESGTPSPWVEERFIRCDGSEIDVEVAGGPFTYLGEPALQVIFRDISERKQAKQRLEQLAHFDPLTGLPNRALFFDRLQLAVAEAQRYGQQMALLFLDLDRFKAINDTLGHDAGDMVLAETARRLKECVRECDTVARMGGDEFTIILGRITDETDATAVAERIIDSLAAPYNPGRETCHLGVSIGISVYPTAGTDVDALLKQADISMYRVKELGRNGYLLHAEMEQAAA